MANTERSGWRDQAYSTWHRTIHPNLAMLDIDWIERCDTCKRALAIYELCADTSQTDKAAFVTKQLARAVGVPGFVVLYQVADGVPVRFKVRHLTPLESTVWAEMTPFEWAALLMGLRECHPLVAYDGRWDDLVWDSGELQEEWG